ncbi:hypothetical protein BKA57DRAFT_474179 [Linnemannia elongata]|nr:hypothetical protein BKA57DRAFT_474179 [Linnemannia elongata]
MWSTGVVRIFKSSLILKTTALLATTAMLLILAFSGSVTEAAPVPFDLLNLVNAKYLPISVGSSGNTSADKIQISDVNESTSN